MRKHRCAFLIAVVLLSLPVYACRNSMADVTPSSLPNDSPTPPYSQEPTPVQPPDISVPTENTEPSTQVPDDNTEPAVPSGLSGEVVISFDYIRQSGAASNQHAVWIEDMDGKVIRTLFASRWTANGGYQTRPDSIALWVEKANLANMTSSEVDAVSGATPGTGSLSYTWDLTDMSGNTVTPGDYIFFVEGTLRWKNFVLYSGVIALGAEPVYVHANVELAFEGDGRYAALTETSRETNMIGPVTAVYTPTT